MSKIKSKKPDENNETKVVRSIFKGYPSNHGKLGKRVEFGSNTHVAINQPGMSIEFFTETVQVTFGIGKDHVGYLIMDEDAWKALNKGQKTNIGTLNSFKKKFL